MRKLLFPVLVLGGLGVAAVLPDLNAQPARPGTPAGASSVPTPAVVTPPAAPAPGAAVTPDSAPPRPERTTAQYGDWTVACAGIADSRRCEAVFTAQDRQTQVSAALAIGQNGRGQPLQMVLRAPVNVVVPVAARLTIDAGPPLLLPFRICNPAGCFAGVDEVNAALLARLRSGDAERSGRAEWRDSTANPVSFAVPFRGLGHALDALMREER